MNPSQAYENLVKRGKEISYLGSASAVLHWDQRTQIPPKGHAHRAGQLGALAGIRHERATDPRIADELAVLEASDLVSDPHSVAAVNIREWRRSYDRATKIPHTLAVALAETTAEAQSVWEKARPQNDWNGFSPWLEHIVALKLEEAEALGYEKEPYDALLEYFEPGETAESVAEVFNRLKPPLVALVDRVKGRAAGKSRDFSDRRFPVEDQRDFGVEVARKLGYDMEGGRLDVSAHPFTTGIGPGDVRITTRYDETDFGQAFFGTVHETGHALYHQGLPLEHWGTPYYSPVSLGIHESQSRLWENLVARSEPFWRHFYPLACSRFSALEGVSLQAFLADMNRAAPSLIRTEADELTYNLHVFLRFDLEVMMLRRELAVKDLPEAWNAKMREYLGLTPPDYATGVMQDTHWSGGAIGYFPTYSLGNIYACQFHYKAKQDLPDLEEFVAAGDFAPLLGWLRERIHSQGSRFRPRELVKEVTAEDINPQRLLDYLETKYMGS